ncbi:hypothetical protein HD553DRAFT_352599 [Filobasidium floriforme]|uniref:uncharacterized protein n=1 Tax=Filobasidium floriforme TaxID=5210 RepID=UPI001E8DC9B3|nr:uncharacterized protein HD553DRAFT_352599 [Filobasidium floriforme]KAH8079772.1 hypothetical protein HD553DRAFT_352599 [Filobasidium floriforme]
MLRIGDIVQRTIVASCIGVSAWACVAAWQGHQARMHRAHDVSISCGTRRTVHRLMPAISALAQISRLAAGDTASSSFRAQGYSYSERQPYIGGRSSSIKGNLPFHGVTTLQGRCGMNQIVL